MNSYQFDIGRNATSLGFTFLFLKYLFPVVIGIVFIILVLLGARYVIKNYLPDLQINSGNWLVIVIILIGIMALLISIK